MGYHTTEIADRVRAEAIERLYAEHCRAGTAISHHLPALRALAESVSSAIEFGVKRGASTTALLLGCRRVISYDIKPRTAACELADIAGPWWDYRIQDTREAEPQPCELLFIDSLHTYEQCNAELWQHAHAVERLLVFHDSITFGSVGARGETGQHDPCTLGIRPAIDELMIRDRRWRIRSHDPVSHGLLVLEAER